VDTALKVGILGASSFIGKNLLLQVPSNWEVYAFYNTNDQFPKWVSKYCTIKPNLIQGDLTDPNSDVYTLAALKLDLVISLVGNTKHVPTEWQPMYDLQVNTHTVINFLNYFSCKKFILFSAGLVYEGHRGFVSVEKTMPMPFHPYGISKLASEGYVRYFKDIGKIDSFIIIRLFGVYGIHDHPRRLPYRLIKQFAFNQNPQFEILGDGTNHWDAIYVTDVVNWLQLIIENDDIENEIYDFGNPEPLSINQVINGVGKLFGIKPQIFKTGFANENARFQVGNSYYQFMKEPYYELRVDFEQGIMKIKEFMEQHPEIYLKEDCKGGLGV